jgi:UDP-N-acetylglucosamine 4-epimerase
MFGQPLCTSAQRAEASSQAYNVACGDEKSLNALIAMIRDNLATIHPMVAGSEPKYSPEREGDIRRSLADIGKARRLLGYAPTHSATAGMKETLQWYAAQLSANEPVSATAL